MALIKHISQIDLEKILVRSIENTYKEALKKTEVLEEGKAPFYSNIPLINHIRGYHDPIIKLGEATSIAMKTRDNIKNRLYDLYKLKEDQLGLISERRLEYKNLKKEYEEELVRKFGKVSAVPAQKFRTTNPILIEREDDIVEQQNKLIALENSVKLLNSSIMTYRRLFAKFSQRAEVAKENAKVMLIV